MIRLRQTVSIIGIILLLGLGLSGVLCLMLPGLIETRILPRIARQAGFPSLNCRINHLGFTQTSAGPLTLGTTADPAVTIERVSLLYDPSSIQKGELKKVVLSGVNIKTLFRKGTLSIPGLKEIVNDTTGNKIDGDPASKSGIPIPPFEELEIKRSVIIVEAVGREYRVPFSLQLKKSTAQKPEATILNGTLKIHPRNTPVTFKFTVTIKEKERIHLSLQAPKVDLLNFADIFSLIPGLGLKGLVALDAETDFSLSPPTVENLVAKLKWEKGSLTLNDHLISAAPKQKALLNRKPGNDGFVLTLQKNNPTAPWKIKINQLCLNAPFTPTVSGIDISIKTTPENFSLQGHWTTRLADRHGPFTWARPLVKKWHLTADLDPQENWEAHLDSPTDDTVWQLKKGGLVINGNSPAITLKASGRGKEITSSALLQLAKIRIKDQSFDLELPDLLIQSKFRQKASTTPSITATLQFEGGILQASDYGLQVLGITGTLPWDWPAKQKTTGRKGKFDCRKIFFKKLDLGRFAASLEQQGEKVLLKGRYDSTLMAGLKMITNGQCGLDQNGDIEATATFEIPACKPEKPVALEKFTASAGSSVINGTLIASGALSHDAHGVSGSATVIIKEADFRNDEKNLLCNGINCRLHFPELPSLRSAPEQKLVFDNLTMGNINCSGATFSFQVESEETLLLEKSRISWCDGNIETQALRVSPAVDHYQSTLYCDRLQLVELLKQLGQVEARGQGSVNGRIPITWDKGRITFDDGFLYSTPGAGGTIKIISGGETLTAGLPTAGPQFAQLDLAREALKDYQYQWAKLTLNSEAEDLLLNLQFDGKPNLPLPFVYKKELGGFARVTADSPGSHFQGISLDINLRLPLNRILQYKDISTMIQ